MNTGIRDQVRLELGEVDVQGAIESQTRRDGGHDLPDQTVQIRIRRSVDVQVPSA